MYSVYVSTDFQPFHSLFAWQIQGHEHKIWKNFTDVESEWSRVCKLHTCTTVVGITKPPQHSSEIN